MKRILIYDDDVAILDVTTFILESEGFKVFSLTSTTDVLADIRKLKPDMLLVDIWMPGLSGDMITKILKTNRETKTIPIVMISASQEVDKIAKVAGADDYLSKPFNIDELNSMVKKYLAFV